VQLVVSSIKSEHASDCGYRHCPSKIGRGGQGEQLASRDDKTQPFPLLQDELEIIRLAVMMYVRFPLLLRNVEDLLHERGIPVLAETGSNLPDTTILDNLVKSGIHAMGFSE
jgi:hypothetical protein